MWIIFSFYWICYNIASVFMLWFFGPKARWILAPWPGIEPTPPASEGEVSTTEPPGKSPYQELSTWSVPPHLQAVHENPETLGKIGFFWAWSFGVFKNSHVGPELRCILIHLPMQEKWVWSLSWEDSLEEEMATHASSLAWRTPWTVGPGGLQPMGSQSQRGRKRLSSHGCSTCVDPTTPQDG